jgi:DNA-binding MarR family transcriptional regulator
LTTRGEELLERLRTPAARAVERLLTPLSPTERRMLLRLLGKLNAAFNETARVPLLLDLECEQRED